MKYLLRSVLIVDPQVQSGRDIEAYIREHNIAKEVAVARDGWSALNYMKQRLSVGKPLPNLTLLDTDSPHFNAWEFLDTLSEELEHSVFHQVYLLCGDVPMNDMIRARMNPMTEGIINKPVTDVEIDRIAIQYAQKFLQNVA